jgi:hypothetical protein
VNKLADEELESSKLREIPPLSKILGLTEGQLVIYSGSDSYGYGKNTDKYVISALYDNYLRITKRNGTSYSYLDIDMKDVEKLIEQRKFTPLTKNGKPAMGKRLGIFNRVWRPE